LPQETHHHRLAVEHRDHRSADADLGVVNPDLRRPSCGSLFSAMFR
jgi:hypothetical protein